MRSLQIHGLICPKSKYYDQTCKLKLFTEKYYKGKLLPILLDSKHISGEEVKSLKVIGNCKWELICKPIIMSIYLIQKDNITIRFWFLHRHQMS